MPVNAEELINFLEWSEPKLVKTRRGERYLRKAMATEQFWELWNGDRKTLKELGISCSLIGANQWEVCWWQELSDEEQQSREREAEAACH